MMARSSSLLWLGLAACVALAVRTRRKHQLLGKLKNQRVAITGGGRGLGLALAQRALRHGARVAICARDSRELDRARDQLLRQFPGSTIITIPCDVTDPRRAREFVELAIAKLGGLDILINNAGVIQVGPWQNASRRDFEESINTHIWGPLHTITAAYETLKQRRGRIVNIASIGGKISVPHLIPYSTSKFGLVGLSEGLSAELARDGITVTTVCPGLMRTGSPRNAWFKGRPRQEYAWFSISDSLPLVTVSADAAASKILAAAVARRRHLVFPLPMALAATFKDVAPGLVTSLSALANRLLPAVDKSQSEGRRGADSQSALSPSLLTILNERAARAYNQIEQ